MNGRVVASALTFACWLMLASCDADGPRASNETASSAPSVDSARTPMPAALSGDTVPLRAHSPEELVAAASAIVAFLRGDVPFDRIRTADTVTFYLSPEGGGPRRNVARVVLRDPANWTIRSRDVQSGRGITYSFAPSRGNAELTTRVGRHLKCREYALSSIYEELARFPHVGVMLAYGTGCLQTHNFTLVFDANEKPPTLIAAVYDQWEW